MLRIRILELHDGQHPSEAVVSVATADGRREELVVDRRSIENNTLAVGYPVGGDENRFLVELPRETLRGLWRIWVARDSVVKEAAA